MFMKSSLITFLCDFPQLKEIMESSKVDISKVGQSFLEQMTTKMLDHIGHCVMHVFTHMDPETV